MKFLLIALLCVTVTAYHDKKSMLESNRIMDPEELKGIKSAACDECQSVIQKIIDASKDPKKLEELKLVLSMLCKETSYIEECRLFVNNIDKFIDTLAPYLKNPKAICSRVHLCSNKKIESFHKLLLEYTARAGKALTSGPKIVCDECEFAVKELKTALENKDLQTDVRNFLRENVCNVLGSYRGFCDLVVDEYLPQFIQQADAILSDPHQVCVDVHACDASRQTPRKKYNFNKGEVENIETEMEKFWGGLTMKSKHGEILAMSCFECQLMVDGLQEEMISQRKEIAGDIQSFACNKIVPENMTASCNDFLSIYLPTVIQMTIEQVTAKGICQANKCCPVNLDQSVYKSFSYQDLESNKCGVMKNLEGYMKENLETSALKKFVESSLTGSICEKAFRIFAPICQQFMGVTAESFVKTTVSLASNQKFSRALQCH
ncbi:unnamed protein product [Caenorhabditis angaria]|uniref:Saposin B-type domain-containing protein n=1 Tax=Caenorhabditis angaria TaxID=860376 RepID=A0A9P1N2I3_9PELO|nr:unnamed protein product [Caenorhabditis angaria]